ncbi:uncharacterized protein TNCV_108871 [Trichonephila clavipes]|nr:uncharacterized protein TNCV_108871 [Trichonephila clavipes]
MVSDGTEFAVGDIERLFEEARRNTKAKHEKWEKYYNRRRRDVQIKISVRIYRHRKCDETEIGTGSSDNGNLRDESSGFDRVQRRSNESRDGKKKGSEVKRELEEKGLIFRINQGRHNREDQFNPEKADEGTTAPTSKSEQDQTTGLPDEEMINNGKTWKGKERVRESQYPWRSCRAYGLWSDPKSRVVKSLFLNRSLWVFPAFRKPCDLLKDLRAVARGEERCGVRTLLRKSAFSVEMRFAFDRLWLP